MPKVSTNNAGNYTVVVTNAYGSVTSQVATLTVAFPPSVTTQPASQTNLAGTNVSFSVTAGGTGPFSYQWQFNGTNLPDNIITTVAGNGSACLCRGRRRGHQRQPILSLKAWPWMLPATCILLTPQQPHSQGGHQRHHHHRGGQWYRKYSGDGGVATNASLYNPSAELEISCLPWFRNGVAVCLSRWHWPQPASIYFAGSSGCSQAQRAAVRLLARWSPAPCPRWQITQPNSVSECGIAGCGRNGCALTSQAGFLRAQVAGGAAIRHPLLRNPNLLDSALKAPLQGHGVGAAADQAADIGSGSDATR